jgi:drug/metabolite transporter (DMT)-like permease
MWFAFGLLAAVSFALVNIADKFLLIKYAKSDIVAVKILGFFSLLVFLVLYLFVSHSRITIENAWVPILSGIFEIFYIFFYLKAIGLDNISYLIPIFSTSPLLIFAYSILSGGGHISLGPIAGSILMIGGVALLIVSKEGHIVPKNRTAVFFMIISTVLFSVQSVILDSSLQLMSLPQALIWSRFGVFLGAVAIAIMCRSFHVREFGQSAPYMFIISEVLYVVTMYFFIRALEIGETAYVVSVSNIQPLFVLIFSYVIWRFWPHVLEEKVQFHSTPLAFVSVIIIVIGSIFINF